MLAGDYANQEPGALDPGWSLSFNAYQAMANAERLLGIQPRRFALTDRSALGVVDVRRYRPPP